ncbi:MAG TPA: sigma-70 family RNA polymerase sigma factor [Myxococcaceae bacterium]|nr:sigma-70 family RNA polymerase sigma factor [Myxococcaceae bacterium]
MALDIEQFYTRYGPMVLRRCERLLRDPEKAADAMHDVFVEILRRKETLVDDAPSSLLLRTATNVCLNRLRSHKRQPEDKDDELLLRIASAEDPAEWVGARSLLDRIFRSEKASTGTIAVLHLLDGLTLEEVAAEVGLSVSGVRKRLRLLKARAAEVGGI